MPNWCYNNANFTCPSKEVYIKLLETIKNNTWFDTFAPLELDPIIYPDGYDNLKACEIWNTKWCPTEININYEDENDFIIDIMFETAWSPPTGVYKQMSKNFNIDLIAYYNEEGNGFFGKCMYSKKENLEVEDVYDYPINEDKLEELRKHIGIGSDLDEYMNCEWINLREMWEEDEENEEIKNE
jgi:hypothetical protein